MFASLEKSWVAIGLRRPPSDLAEERGGSGSLPATDCRSLASVQSCRWLGSGRGMAIANPVRYHRFFRRYLSNAPLMDLRVGAVPFNIDLGLDRRSTSTDLLENITIICLPKVLGAAASYLERSEFRLQLRFVWAPISTAFGIGRSIGGILVLNGFATRCSIFVLRGQRGCPGDRAHPQRKPGLRSRTKRSVNRAIEKFGKTFPRN